jgi:1-acyl-sn-glycerol-3-phosphate acyltransferase
VKALQGIFGLLFKIYVGIVLLITFFIFYVPILILLSKVTWKKMVFKVHIVWSYTFRILTFYHVRFCKKSPLPKGPYVIIANHSSYLDIFLLYSILPTHPFLFLGKSEILKYPLFKTLFKRLNIPVYRNDRVKAAKAFIQAKKAIQEGWSIVIFPEGTIPDSHWPQMIPIQRRCV